MDKSVLRKMRGESTGSSQTVKFIIARGAKKKNSPLGGV